MGVAVPELLAVMRMLPLSSRSKENAKFGAESVARRKPMMVPDAGSALHARWWFDLAAFPLRHPHFSSRKRSRPSSFTAIIAPNSPIPSVRAR